MESLQVRDILTFQFLPLASSWVVQNFTWHDQIPKKQTQRTQRVKEPNLVICFIWGYCHQITSPVSHHQTLILPSLLRQILTLNNLVLNNSVPPECTATINPLTDLKILCTKRLWTAEQNGWFIYTHCWWWTRFNSNHWNMKLNNTETKRCYKSLSTASSHLMVTKQLQPQTMRGVMTSVSSKLSVTEVIFNGYPHHGYQSNCWAMTHSLLVVCAALPLSTLC